jgi:heavy metal translocating P-type ATPase
MSQRRSNSILLALTAISLSLGFVNSHFWTISGLIGLATASFWLIRDLRNKTMGSDFLAFLSLTSTLLTDELLAASLIAVMLSTGRVLESWAAGQAKRALKSLLERMPRNATRVKNDQTLEVIAISKIVIGDRILVKAGEIVPTDGELLNAAHLDESALTGEPLPVQRQIGEEISSGILNAGSPFEYEALSTSADSTYEGIINLVKSAQANAAPGVRIANIWALRFVPVALSVAALAWLVTGDIDRAVAVLVAATPCPLILAVPIAIVSGLSQSARNGAVIKGGAILELLSKADTVLLDKTGTLTHGGPAVTQIATAPGITEVELITCATSVDQYSPHVIAKSIIEYAKSKEISQLTATDINEIPGKQISGMVNDQQITVGQMPSERPAWLRFDKPLLVAVTRDDQLIGVIGLDDPIRPESQALITALRKSGVSRIALVTGDRTDTANAVARELGITEVFSEISAKDKLVIAKKAMESSTGSVIVVGDGINDAPALAAAHVGVAMGARGASAASEAADVIIVDDSIDRLIRAIRISKRARRKALQAAGIGMTMSLAIMATGALGVTSASQGALAQELIDVIAILWALTTLRKKNFKA